MAQGPRKIQVILLSILFVFALAVLSQNNESQEENAVYVTVLGFSVHSPDSHNMKLLSSPSACQMHDIGHLTVEQPLLTTFLQANSADATPIRLPALKNHYTVVDWAQTRRLNDSIGELEKIRSTEEDVVMLSRVGFDESRRQALVCIAARSRGTFYVLRKEADTWVVVSLIDAGTQ